MSSFLAFEAAAAARKLLADVMLVQPGEEVVITVDTAGDWPVAFETARAAATLGASPVLLLYETRPEAQMEPPPAVAAAVASADVWIEYTVQYVLYTRAKQAALANGCRYACLTGLDVDALVRSVGRVDYPALLALGDALVRLLRGAHKIRVSSREGTDLSARLAGAVEQSGRLATERGMAVMLGGQVGHLPAEETIQGRIVVDGAIWPPNGIGALREPVELLVEGGSIQAVQGGSAAATYRAWLDSFSDPNLLRMAHYVYGFNPGVTQLRGLIAEDERLFGSMTFGFGATGDRQAATHTDCIVLRPSVYLDGVEIERDGRYVHPELVRLCRDLRVPGY